MYPYPMAYIADWLVSPEECSLLLSPEGAEPKSECQMSELSAELWVFSWGQAKSVLTSHSCARVSDYAHGVRVGYLIKVTHLYNRQSSPAWGEVCFHYTLRPDKDVIRHLMGSINKPLLFVRHTSGGLLLHYTEWCKYLGSTVDKL